MKNLKYFYRNGIPVATANSDDLSTYYFYAGFPSTHDYYNKSCVKIDGILFYHYYIKFENETLNQFWWLGWSDYNQKSIYDKSIHAVDSISSSDLPNNISNSGFKLI